MPLKLGTQDVTLKLGSQDVTAYLGAEEVSGFDPTSIPGLLMWSDASDQSRAFSDDAATTLAANDDGVAVLKSKVGPDLAQTIQANRPIFKTGLRAGKAGLRFDGTNDSMPFTSTITQVVGQHIFAAVDTTNLGTAYRIFLERSSPVGTNLALYLGSGTAGDSYKPSVYWSTRRAMATETVQRPAVLRWHFNTGLTEMQVDGGTTVSDSAGPALTSWSAVGNSSAQQPAFDLYELLIYDRDLTDAEIQKIEGYLAWKWGLQAQLPSNHPYAYSFPGFGSQARPDNGDALAWESAVYSNSGSVSVGTLAAVNTFCNAIDAASIRDRFYRLNLFAGTGLNAALVPLYRGPTYGGTTYGNATDTNNGPFVSGDYAETGTSTGGLKGNGSSKYLDTGFNPVSASASESDFHLSVHTKGAEAAGTTRISLGGFAGSDELFLGWVSGGTQERGVIAGSSGERALLDSSGLEGSLAISAGSGQSQQAYVNGSAIGSPVTASGAFPDQSLFVAAANGSGSPTQYSLARYFRAYSIGLNMTATQASNYHTALVAFQTALGRQV
jgi:hypothetical protein